MMTDPAPTRQRLLDAGMELFAHQGFAATTVGEIEAAVGLQPRRGALYKHYLSKGALLEEGVRRHIDSVATGAAQVDDLELTAVVADDPALLRPFVRGLGRWFLDELDRQRDLVHVLEHDGRRFDQLVAQVRNEVIDAGNQAATRLLAAAAPDIDDPEATTVLLLASLAGLRRTTWTFGGPPLDVNDERALTRWTDMVLAILDTSTSSV